MLDIFDPEKFREFEGDLIPTRIQQIQEQRQKETEARKSRQREYQKKMEEQREKEREILRQKRAENAKSNGTSRIINLEYDSVDLENAGNSDDEKPEMKDGVIDKKIIEESNVPETILIKKQSKDETVEIFDEMKSSMLKTLNTIVKNYLPAQEIEAKKFDKDEFYEKLKLDHDKYPLNMSWIQDFGVMSCPAQSFLERFSIQGEFFENYL